MALWLTPKRGTFLLIWLLFPASIFSNTSPVTPLSGVARGALNNEGHHDGIVDLGHFDTWTFTADRGNLVQIRGVRFPGTNGLALRLRIFDPTGTLVAQTEGTVSTNISEARLSFRPDATSTFRLVVDAATPEGTGNYRLYLVRLPASVGIPPNDTGGALTNGENHAGTIDVGDLDAWTFQANAGDRILLRAGQAPGGTALAPRIEVYDQGGSLGAAHSGAMEARVEFSPAQTGTFTVLVSSGPAGGRGDYLLFFLKLPGTLTLPSGDEGGRLINGNNHEGATGLGDVDPWFFNANAGDRVNFKVRQLPGSASYSPRARVFDARGELVAYINNPIPVGNASNSATVLIPATGPYTVLVDSSLSGGFGRYRLNYILPTEPSLPARPAGAPLTNGGSHQGDISPNEEEAWSFSAQAGDEIYLRAGKLSGTTFKPRVRVFAPNAELVSDASNSSDTIARQRAPLTGTYTVLVSSGEPGASGTYRLHYFKVPGTFSVSSGDEGSALINGGSHEGTISLGDVDGWTFEANAGDQFYLRAGNRSGGAFEPSLLLYDPNGNLVQGTSDPRDPLVFQEACLTGVYTVLIGAGNQGDTGDYQLYYLQISRPFIVPRGDEGGALTNGSHQDGTITIGDVDVWTLEANAGDDLYLRVGNRTAGYFKPALRVYDPRGTLLQTARGIQETLLIQRASLTGTYTVLISNVDPSAPGDYRLYYLKVPGQFIVPVDDEGGPLVNGGNPQGIIALGDVDPWTLSAQAGDEIYLRVANLGGGFFQPSLRLYDPNGGLLQAATNGSDLLLLQRAAVTGVYTVLVSSGDPRSSAGVYQLQYFSVPGTFIVPSGDQGGLLPRSGTVSGVTTIGDADAWTFEANAGNEISLLLRDTSGGTNLFPRLRLFDPTGQLVSMDSAASAARLTVKVPNSGLYILVADSGVTGGTGNYEISTLGLPAEGTQLRIGPHEQNSITLNWPASLTGYVLQQTPTLARADWQDVAGVPTNNGINFRLVLSLEGTRFFRLRPPASP